MSEVQAVIVKDQKNRSTTKGDTKSMEAGRLVKTEPSILQNNTPKHRSWTVGSKRRLTRGAKDDFWGTSANEDQDREKTAAKRKQKSVI